MFESDDARKNPPRGVILGGRGRGRERLDREEPEDEDEFFRSLGGVSGGRDGESIDSKHAIPVGTLFCFCCNFFSSLSRRC